VAEEKRLKIRTSNGIARLPYNCVLSYVDAQGNCREAKGRTFVVGGVEVDLFSIGSLCQVLGRSHRCIYKWEALGFPRSMWRVADARGCQRWYSRKQILAIRAIYESFNRLEKKSRNQLGTFIAAVRKVFYTIDRPVKERKNSD